MRISDWSSDVCSSDLAGVDLVESAPGAASVARRNAELVTRAGKLRASLRVHRATVAGFLRVPRGPYDLVFLDPPYDLAENDLTEALGLLAAHLAPDAVVIVERARRSPEPAWSEAGLEPLRSRAYGEIGRAHV